MFWSEIGSGFGEPGGTTLPTILRTTTTDKDLESEIQDDLRLDQVCSSETEVERFMLKALASD